MRPEVLFPLFKPITSLPGVGQRIAAVMKKATGEHMVDLLWHLPCGIIDRRYAPEIAEAKVGLVATITLQVDKHFKPANRRLPYKVYCSDETGKMALVFFHAHGDYLRRILPEGEVRVVSGRVEAYGDEIQITHPDHIGELKELDRLKTVEPVYRLSAGLTLKKLSGAVLSALDEAPTIDEWIDLAYIERQGWEPWRQALLKAHAPTKEQDLDAVSPVRQRLAYDELLANQLALAMVRYNLRRTTGRPTIGDGSLNGKVLDALTFRLTSSQETTLDEIRADMATDVRMLRLLQGDVGSGKTIVAILAMMTAIEAGGQAVIMAPTDVLARQHLATMEPLASAAGIKIVLLTGREKGPARRSILEAIESGGAALAVGTHALFQEQVSYCNLRLAVIDEQHRFGVHQRLSLTDKGQAVDVLVMTATPIPRTLMLTAYGDMDVSRITEKPAGRKPVITRVMPIDRIGDITEAVKRALDKKSKVYWVCPIIEESEVLDIAAAEDRYAELKGIFAERVGLVHGRMKGRDKDAAMQAFIEGPVDILVATTVIEVGVDVPSATVMVIEHAERFGLAQLHQLRGRIGRGLEDSTCLLLYARPLTSNARDRLNIMRESEDGFLIAEEDLRLRGAGELMGTRQSGLPEFRIADLAVHSELLATARDDAKLILNSDPELKSDRGKALRTLLYLFERDVAVKYLRSG